MAAVPLAIGSGRQALKGQKPGFLEKPGFFGTEEGQKPGFSKKPGFFGAGERLT
jgi:hypothetical protein